MFEGNTKKGQNMKIQVNGGNRLTFRYTVPARTSTAHTSTLDGYDMPI